MGASKSIIITPADSSDGGYSEEIFAVNAVSVGGTAAVGNVPTVQEDGSVEWVYNGTEDNISWGSGSYEKTVAANSIVFVGCDDGLNQRYNDKYIVLLLGLEFFKSGTYNGKPSYICSTQPALGELAIVWETAGYWVLFRTSQDPATEGMAFLEEDDVSGSRTWYWAYTYSPATSEGLNLHSNQYAIETTIRNVLSPVTDGNVALNYSYSGNLSSFGTQQDANKWIDAVSFPDLSGNSLTYVGLGLSSSLVVGNFVKIDEVLGYVKAQADSAVNAESVGVVTAVDIATDTVTISYVGVVDIGANLTYGTTYYLDPTTSGAYTATAPSTPGQVVKPLFTDISGSGKVLLLSRNGVLVS